MSGTMSIQACGAQIISVSLEALYKPYKGIPSSLRLRRPSQLLNADHARVVSAT